jgi:hypothetical protein
MVMRLLYTLLHSDDIERLTLLYHYHENLQLSKYMLQYFCELQQKVYKSIINSKKTGGKNDSAFYASLGKLTRYDIESQQKHKQMSR